MELKKICIAITLITLTNGCKKKPPKYIIHDVKPFQSLILQIKSNGKPLDDSTLAHTLMYYYDHNRYVDKPDDIEQGDKTIYDDKYLMSYFAGKLAGIGLVSSPYIAPVSAEGITNDFYLKFPDGNIDTISLFADPVSSNQAEEEACHCTTPIRIVKYNRRTLTIDSVLLKEYNLPIYVCNKK